MVLFSQIVNNNLSETNIISYIGVDISELCNFESNNSLVELTNDEMMGDI